MLRNAVSFQHDPAVAEKRVWSTAGSGAYEFHTHPLQSEMVEWASSAGLCDPARGDVVCLYRKARGPQQPWLREDSAVSLRNAGDEFGKLTLATKQQLLGWGSVVNRENPALGAAMLSLCVPETPRRNLGFTVTWSDDFSPSGRGKGKREREAFAQDFAGESKGYGSTVVGVCVARLSYANRGSRDFWSDMYRVYDKDVFGMPGFAAYAETEGLPLEEFQELEVEQEEEEEEEEPWEWPEDYTIGFGERGRIFVQSPSDPEFRKPVSVREVEQHLLLENGESGGEDFADFIDAWRRAG
jgi:hypothetical protein